MHFLHISTADRLHTQHSLDSRYRSLSILRTTRNTNQVLMGLCLEAGCGVIAMGLVTR